MQEELKRFIPALVFVGKFVALYVVGNLFYGWMVESFSPQPDPMTEWVTVQTAQLLSLTGYPSVARISSAAPTVVIDWSGNDILEVYEGCNGLNVMIVFLAFMIAVGPYVKKFYWFVAGGLLLIHVLNLARIWGLFLVAVHLPAQFYFVHKYLFTGILYVVIFLLWLWWFSISGLKKS